MKRVGNLQTQRATDRAASHAHAVRIQAKWRCQRFATHHLSPSLQFATSESLIPEVQKRMVASTSSSSTTPRDLTTAAVDVNHEELQSQIDKYASELRVRVEARRLDAEQRRLQLQRQHRDQEDLKKKQHYQNKRRYENACRRWNYFAGRLLRVHRDESHLEIQARVAARRRSILATERPSLRRMMVPTAPATHRCANKTRCSNSPSLMKSAVHRNFMRQFVAKAIARGLSRVLCTSNMDDTTTRNATSTPAARPKEETKSTKPPTTQNLPAARESAATDADSKRLRIGILLCDVHFGAKYMGLYQRFLERAAKERGVLIEWQLFNCIMGQFPSKALQRVLDGFLVAGGPNNSASHALADAVHGERPDTSESRDSDSNVSSEPTHRGDDGADGARVKKQRQPFGPWRKNLHKVLRQLYSDKQTRLAGLGLGHVVLAEALGAKCGRHDWEDGWNVLDPKLFDLKRLESSDSKAASIDSGRVTLSSKYVGIKYLHGEYVQSMEFAPKGMTVWRSLDQRFVSCFQDKWVLSFDGFPECGTFVFETMSEMYDLDKQKQANHATNRMRSPPHSHPVRPPPGRRVGVVIDTVLTLEEKKQLLDVTEISQAVAHALLDHFQTTWRVEKPESGGGSTEIAAIVNPADCTDIEDSIRKTVGTSGVTSILMRVRSTLDGHLVVLCAQLDSFVRDHERKLRTGRHPSLLAVLPSGSPRQNSVPVELETLLSLHTLRDQKLVLLNDTTILSSSERNSTSGFPGKQTFGLNMSIQLPSLTSSSSNARDLAPHPNRKRPQVAKRVKSSGIGVLTLSEALTRYQSELSTATLRTNANLSRSNHAERKLQLASVSTSARAPMVIIQIADEECGSQQVLQRKSPDELRALWVRLVAALRVSEISDDRVCILARQTMILDFFRSRQPLWTYIKDCRRANVLPRRHHVKRVSWYARYADVLLFDQEMLLSHSAKENEALFQQAHIYGLKIFAARDETRIAGDAGESSNNHNSTSSSEDNYHSGSSKRKLTSKTTYLGKQQRHRTFGDAGILAKPAAADKEEQIVEMLLLQLTGIDGVVTSTPEIAIAAATEKLQTNGPIVSHVKQLFRTWQSSENPRNAAVLLRKRSSLGADELQDNEDEDYMGISIFDGGDDDSLDDKEVALEMARQYAEHGVRRPPSSSYVPLRPLQPKRGDQVLGSHHRQSSSPVVGDGTGSDGARSRLRSIGTFRNAFQRSQPETVSAPPHRERDAALNVVVAKDDALRSPESIEGGMSTPLQVTTTPSPRVMRQHQQSSAGNRNLRR